MMSLTRGLARVVLVLVALAAAALGGAGPAAAHPTLLFTDPGTDTAVSEPPQSITLLFNEAVALGPHPVRVLDGAGRDLPVGAATTAKDGRAVTAPVTGALTPGTYTVRWQVTGIDGDLVEQDFRFAVGTALTGAGSEAGQTIAWLDAVLRWMLFGGLAVALGGLIGERFTSSARAENPALPALRSQVAAGAAIGLAGVVGLGVRLVLSADTALVLWQGGAGRVLTAEAVGLLVTLAVVAAGRGRWAIWPLLLVVAAEGVRSHADTAEPGWGAALTGVHLAAAALWVGALVHTTRAVIAWRREPAAVRWVLRGYLRLAGWVFAAGVVTGAASMLVLIPLPTLVSTTYGRVLLVKLALVTVAAGLALGARRLVLRSPGRIAAVATVVRAESAVLVIVLAASAVLVSSPPVSGAQQQPPPPVPQGPVLPLGTLAGQVGVSVAASDGQAVVRLSTPRRGDYYAPEPDQDFALTGRLDTGDGEGGALSFRGCGRGCFVAPAAWTDGDNVLSLHAEADGWRGGTISELIAWPPAPAAADLTDAVAQLRAASTVTVYEAVTSDTTTGTPDPMRLDLPADFFLAQEPYADGTAPLAVRTSRGDEPVRLALGYPAASINVLLTLDEHGRISEETLADTKHLVTRRFLYPDHE